MKAKLWLLMLTGMMTMPVTAQQTLDYFLRQAMRNSPLIISYKSQKAINDEEMKRLKAAYLHSRIELSGDLLFVPIISTDNGKTSFKADAQDATNYYGYDLAQSSSHLNAGINWLKPLTGGKGLRDEQERLKLGQTINDNYIHLTEHDLGRQITEQFLLCQLDKMNEESCLAIDSILVKQMETVSHLADHGLTSPTDVRLVEIERQNNSNVRQVCIQSYLSHRAELNTICGISDTSELAPIHIMVNPLANSNSAFQEQYRLDSLQAKAEYNCFRDLYRPQLSLYANGGSQTGTYLDFYKRWGVSAGLHFSWTLADGKQMQNRQRQMAIQQETISQQRQNAEAVRRIKLDELSKLMTSQDLQISSATNQTESYRKLLTDYQKEIMAGRRSVVDYINVFHSYRQQISTLNELKINREILANTYNYWNW